MTTAFSVSPHARLRYAQYVDSSRDPRANLLRMWNFGQSATDDDMIAYRAEREVGSEYRIGLASNGVHFLMVLRERTLITIIGP